MDDGHDVECVDNVVLLIPERVGVVVTVLVGLDGD
jgi:hypothetical protein